jgi:hypothetical protein
MSGSHVSLFVMPIVIAVSLFSWIALVLYANAHPERGRHRIDLKTEVRGGSFQAIEGGRQLMPIPEHRPVAVPGPRAATASETYQVPAEAEAGEPQPAHSGARSAGDSGQTGGLRIR